jgi:hypothetical protein
MVLRWRVSGQKVIIFLSDIVCPKIKKVLGANGILGSYIAGSGGFLPEPLMS